MTKTDQVTTITQLENELNEKFRKNATVNISTDYDRQKCEIVQEDIQNNNEIKCGVLCEYKYEAGDATTLQPSDDVAVAPKRHRALGLKLLEFDAPLKWDNITGIIVIHAMFVYAMVCAIPLPKCWQTYLWGKYSCLVYTRFCIVFQRLHIGDY